MSAVAQELPEKRERIPVTVVAGFLGAGKTTVLNRVLAGRHGVRVAVLVNDFGSIDIDGRLVVARDATVITLDNGCICCSISGDLVTQLTGLLEAASPPEHVLVETSGVSDPGRLLVAFRDPHLRSLARIDAVITLVDAANVDEIPPAMLELARRQLAAADVIVFNKADLVEPGRLAELRERLSYPRARTVAAANGGVPLEILLGIDHDADEAVRGHGTASLRPSREHHELFSTWAWETPRPLSYERVRELLATLPAGVYRAKGFLHLAETPGERIVAHVVGRRVDLRPLGSWGGGSPRSELVFIGLGPEIDRTELERRLLTAVAPGY